MRELRHAQKLTQVRMGKTLGITQDSVSRIEKRSDLLLSTLRKTVMGGNLSLAAEFPDRAPVILSGTASSANAKPMVVNRHWILHGRGIPDGTQTDCLRLLQAIHTFAFLIGACSV